MASELVIKSTIEVYNSKAELPDKYADLVDEAITAAGRAYSPYSKLQVGAALLLKNGQTVQGNNQENAAYPAGLCAERVAIFSASSQLPGQSVEAIAVVSRREQLLGSAFPCGSCRQVMIEFEARQETPIKVIMADADGKFLVAKAVKDLLPLAFTKSNL